MATKQSTKKQLATQEQAPKFLQGLEDDQRGSEEVTGDDLTIPRLELAQGLSKCLKKNHAQHIEGAQEGMFYNNLTRELYGESVVVIPILFRKEYLVWRDQDEGGGFAGAYSSREEAEEQVLQQEQPDQWEAVETHQQFCALVHEDGRLEEIVLSMSKSKLKVSRKWNSLIRLKGGPRFSRQYILSGVADQNQKGQDFSNIAVEYAGFVQSEDNFKQCEKAFEAIRGGKVQADYSHDQDGEEDADGEF